MEIWTILYQLESREWRVIRYNCAVWSGLDPRPVISVHVKGGLVTTDLVPNHFGPVHDDFRGTALVAVSRGDTPVEDVVPVGRTGEYSGVAVITSSYIYFCQREFNCVPLSCNWIDPKILCWNSKKKNSSFDCWKKKKLKTDDKRLISVVSFDFVFLRNNNRSDLLVFKMRKPRTDTKHRFRLRVGW